MQDNLRRAGWRSGSALVTALVAVLGSPTLAPAQFSTAIPMVKEKELPPPPAIPASSPPPSKASRNLPMKQATSGAAARPRWAFWPSLSSESRKRSEDPPAASPKAKAAGPRPSPSAPTKNQVATVAHRFVDGAALPSSSIPPARTTGISRIPDIRLRPIGVIPPEDGP